MNKRSFLEKLFVGIWGFLLALIGIKRPSLKKHKGYFIAEFKAAPRPIPNTDDMMIIIHPNAFDFLCAFCGETVNEKNGFCLDGRYKWAHKGCLNVSASPTTRGSG